MDLKFHGGDRSCASCVAQSSELRNPSNAVAQSELRNPESGASQVAQSWELRKLSCAILVAQSDQRVAQAKLRNPEKFRNRIIHNEGFYSAVSIRLYFVNDGFACICSLAELISKI